MNRRHIARAVEGVSAIAVSIMCAVVVAGMATGHKRQFDRGVAEPEAIAMQFGSGAAFLALGVAELLWMRGHDHGWWRTRRGRSVAVATVGLFCFWTYARIQQYAS